MVLRKLKSSSIGNVEGPFGEERMVCQFVHMTNAQGCTWYGGDPMAFTSPVLLVQLVLIYIAASATWMLLKPLKQSLVSAQLIAGIIMGRSFLGNIRAYAEKLFPPGGRLILETFADVGFMFHLFILGLQIDISLVKRAGRNAIVIGFACFLVPLAMGLLANFILPHIMEIEDSVKSSLPFVATANSISAFPVITSLLNDLNILNSEVGRIATLASLVSDMCNYIVTILYGSISLTIRSNNWNALGSIVWAAAFIIIIVFAIRPFVLLMAKRIPEGQQMRETHFIIVVIIVLLCGLSAEILGQPSGLGPFILGIIIPDGLPLGSALINKLDIICSGFLMPAKFAISGLTMDIFALGRGNSGLAFVIIIFVGYTAKFTATLIPALLFSILFRDAVTLALIMCCKGIIEAVLYMTMQENGTISDQAYSFMIISLLLVTAIARPLIWYIYDPSARYSGQHRNTILGLNRKKELRILVCIHNEENVPPIMNLIEASIPQRNQPISVFALNLMELKGRGAAVLETNTRKGKLTSSRSWSKHAANAFDLLAQRYEGSIIVQHFNSVAPYASMHDDVCTIASEQSTNIVIIPFHKHWSIESGFGSNSPSIRMVNQNVIQKSPCSVGVLVDRGQIADRHSILKANSMLRTTMLFLGGADDCEALAYCSRLIENPQISLTFVWLRPWDQRKHAARMDDTIDIELVKQFRANTLGDEKIIYREEFINDAIGTTKVIRSIEDGCDLCIVGRYHEPDSELLVGLTEWSECPELGLIGDMLATSDFRFSVLVVQQQAPGADFMDKRTLHPIASTYVS